MITLTFKDVGQGDTIIIEWQDDKGIKKTGILDCKKTPNRNAALEHVISNKVNEISFIIISHPHLDHFSGFYDLINHCIANKIHIKNVFHTSERVPQYLETAGKDNEELEEELFNLFVKIDELERKHSTRVNVLRGLYPDDELNRNNDRIYLNKKEGIYFKVLAPRNNEYNKFSKGIKYKWDEEGESGKSDANWLSTTLKVVVKNQFVLLTSDTSKQVFSDLLKEINDKRRDDFNNLNLAIGQIPHHGSKNNFSKGFWKKIKKTDSVAIISVGQNNYNHPHSKTKDTLVALRYNLHSTNKVGALLEDSTVTDAYSLSLTPYTLLVTTSVKDELNGDKVYTITDKDYAWIS